MKRIINLIILITGTLFVYIAISGIITLKCPFKSLLNIRCPGCGLTRSFRAILNLDFISAIKYNILGIPLFIFCFLFIIFLIKDIIINSNATIKIINKFLSKNYIYIIVILIITTIINNINGI